MTKVEHLTKFPMLYCIRLNVIYAGLRTLTALSISPNLNSKKIPNLELGKTSVEFDFNNGIGQIQNSNLCSNVGLSFFEVLTHEGLVVLKTFWS